MTRLLKVLIVDPDNFFALGLRQAVEMHLQSQGIKVMFLSAPPAYIIADLIFWAPGYDSTVIPMGLLMGKAYTSRLIMVMSHQRAHLVKHVVPWVFYRHQSHSVLSALIDRVLYESTIDINTLTVNTYRDWYAKQLSPREIEVIRCVSKGQRLSEIADKLKINVKTVSCHKRSAMGKLQLKRTIDLYNWFLSNNFFSVSP